VRLEAGGVEHRAVAELRAVIARGSYLVLERDTVLGADFVTDRDLVIVNADVRLSGRVVGAIVVARGALFLRPGAIVGGPVVTLGGDVMRSALAAPVTIIESPARLEVLVVPEPEGYAIRTALPPDPTRVRFPGFFGLSAPTHDRVNGLTLRWTTAARPLPGPGGPELWASAALRVARPAVDGGIGLRLPVGGGAELHARVERATVSNEAWYRGDLTNTLSSIALGSDLRDYHESDRVVVGVGSARRRGIGVGEHLVTPALQLAYSRDRSLDLAGAWSLLRPADGWRPNPAIDDGEIASGYLGGDYRWRGIATRSDLRLGIERTLPNLGDFQFTQASGQLHWQTVTFGAQTLAVDAYARATLDADPAPRQRWTILGGGATIPSLRPGARRGDNFAWVHSLYTLPLGMIALGPLGHPSLHLAHTAGNAWVTGTSARPWAQNLGVGVGVSFVYARLYFDPESPRGTASLVAGLSF
jgi:hypothetical protein